MSQQGIIIVSDSEEEEMRNNHKRMKPSQEKRHIQRIEIDLTADESPPGVTKSRGTPAISTKKKNNKFADHSSFIEFYCTSSSSSSSPKAPSLSTIAEPKRKRIQESLSRGKPTMPGKPLSQQKSPQLQSLEAFSRTAPPVTIPSPRPVPFSSPNPNPVGLTSSFLTTPQRDSECSDILLDTKILPNHLTMNLHQEKFGADERRSSLENLSSSKTKKSVLKKKGKKIRTCPSPKTLLHLLPLETESSSNSNQSTCSLSNLPLAVESHSASTSTSTSSLFTDIISNLPTTTPLLPSTTTSSRSGSSSSSSHGKKDTSMRRLDLNQVLMLVMKRDQVISLRASPPSSSLFSSPSQSYQLTNKTSPGSGYQLLAKFLQKDSFTPPLQKLIDLPLVVDTLYPLLEISFASALSNSFDLGDCSRLIGECHSLIQRSEFHLTVLHFSLTLCLFLSLCPESAHFRRSSLKLFSRKLGWLVREWMRIHGIDQNKSV
jgi:hypothetical protein